MKKSIKKRIHLSSHTLSLVLLMVIGATIFIVLYNRVNNPFIQDLMTALLSALITVAITAVLLRFQTDAELDREKNDLFFKEKFDVYNDFLSQFTQVLSQSAQSQAVNHDQLEIALYKTLLFVSSRENFDTIYHVVVAYLEKGEIKSLSKVVAALRAELQPDENWEGLFNQEVEQKVDQLFLLMQAAKTK